MWIKICGNTNLDDCLRAADLGADAVGFVFAAGKRTVTAAQVAAITPRLPHALEKIGVFTTGNFDQIAATVEASGLTGVQLHGSVDLALLEQVRMRIAYASGRCSILQVLPWWTDRPPEAQGDDFARGLRELSQDGSADAILIDSRTASASGGTGQTFDWKAAHALTRAIDHRIVVAGGLTPENVSEAITQMEPFGVDVVSGVESSPGIKAPDRLAAFLRNAHAAAG